MCAGRRPARAAAVLVALLMNASTHLGACPSCGLAASDAESSAAGYAYSAIGLAGAPLVLFGSVLLVILRSRRATAQGAASRDGANNHTGS